VLGIGLPQSLLEVVELIDRAIGLIMELIFEFRGPDNISDRSTDQNDWNHPPDQSRKGGRRRWRAGSLGEDRSKTGHGSTLTQARAFSFACAEI